LQFLRALCSELHSSCSTVIEDRASPTVRTLYLAHAAMKHLAALTLALAAMAACTVGDEPPHRGDEDAVLVLSDDALATELRDSPAHNTTTVFQRVGIMFDSDRPTSIEIATSRDGTAWSAWQPVDLRHVEGGATSAFVGEVAAEQGLASYFKLRGAAGTATHARIDVLESMGTEWEGGDPDASAELVPGNLRADIGGLTYHTRAEWGSRAATCSGSHSPKKMTVHMSETPNNDTMTVPARMRQMQAYHRDVRGWCDIGYHFAISADGQIWEGRPITKLGAHAAGANTNNVGIVLIGSFNTQPPTDAALASTSALIKAIATKYAITISRTTVKGHREVGTTSTDCPGAKTFALLGSIVEAAQGSAPQPPAPPVSSSVTGIVYVGTDPSARISGATISMDGKTATTTSAGTFELAGIAPGSYAVTVSKAGFRSVTITRDTRTSSFIGVGIDEEAVTSPLPTGTAKLQGVVYRGTDSSSRIGGAKVRLSTGHTATADANGYFLIPALPAGNITVFASSPGLAERSVTRALASGTTEWGSVSLR